MFENKEYIKKLESIRQQILISRLQLAKELRIAYSTFIKIMNPENKTPLRFPTMRKIKEFIDNYENQHGKQL